MWSIQRSGEDGGAHLQHIIQPLKAISLKPVIHTQGRSIVHGKNYLDVDLQKRYCSEGRREKNHAITTDNQFETY